MGDGASTEAGFVGEDATGNTLLHTEEDASDSTTGKGFRVKRAQHNGRQDRRELLDIQDDDAQSQHDIEQSHERHQLFGHAANALDAAQQDHCDQHCHDDADDEVQGRQKVFYAVRIGQNGRVDGGDDGVDLRCVAGTEDGQDAEQGIENRQPLPLGAKAVLHIVHGASDQLTVLVPLPEMNGQRDFGELGAHAKQCRAPHPEDCARAADGNCAGDAGDVAGTDRCRQRGTDSLKRRHRTIRSILLAENASDGRFDGIRKFTDLQKMCPHTEQQAHADDADHRRDAPDEIIDGLIDRCDRLDHTLSPFV